MAEAGGANIEVAHHLNEHEHGEHGGTSKTKILEVFEAVVLALVAIATAWAGYQAAKWDSVQSLLYGRASKLRVEAQGKSGYATQIQLYNALTVSEWLKADAAGNTKLAELFERRLLPEIRPAFEAWKATDPIHNPNAPAGPAQMQQYHSAPAEEAQKLDQEAAGVFEEGTQ